MGKTIAKSKGNADARRAGQRNQGLPSGVKRRGAYNSLPNTDEFLMGASSTFELNRRLKMLRRWKVSFGMMPEMSELSKR